jgi:hypothetical protein
MASVGEWLASLGLSEYADRFAEHRIDFSILRDLTEQDLKDELFRLDPNRAREMKPSVDRSQ